MTSQISSCRRALSSVAAVCHVLTSHRAQPRACNATEFPNYDSAMYTPTGADWKVDKLDWMQLGFLIKFVLTHTEAGFSYHKMTTDAEEPFVKILLEKGIY